jgi:hypothetical protein
MNHTMVAIQLAQLIMDVTDPKITRWKREQLEAQARAKAKNYLSKFGGN